MNKLALSIIVISVLLTGCSVFKNNPIYGDEGIIRDRSQDYEQAEKGQRLKIPEHLSPKQTEDRLQIPYVSRVAAQQGDSFEVPRPEFFYAESGSEAVSLKREGGNKVIVVDEDITNVWVKLLEFWEFNNIKLAASNPHEGWMETQWIHQEAKEFSLIDTWVKRLTFQDIPGDTKDKLRISLKPVAGDIKRTSILMQHVRFPEDEEVADINWGEQARDVSYKSDMMFEMLRYLGKAVGKRDAQTLLAFREKHRLDTQLGRDSQGNPVLKLTTDIDTGWAEINQAADDADLDVGTRDSALGILYITYTTSTPFEDKEEMGFFEWLHSDREPIKIDTSTISEALGVESKSDGISYTSGKTAERFASRKDKQASGDLFDPEDEGNKKGYKIWFAGKPIYIFGGEETGVYNQSTGKFEHTGQYKLKLTRTRSGVYLGVLTPENTSAPAIVAEEILWEIKEHLPKSE